MFWGNQQSNEGFFHTDMFKVFKSSLATISKSLLHVIHHWNLIARYCTSDGRWTRSQILDISECDCGYRNFDIRGCRCGY